MSLKRQYIQNLPLSMAADSAGFESYLRGSWWNVQIKEERSSMFLVSYNADKHEDWSWVPLTELRLSSRSCDGWDCYILKKGMDVAVLAKHPHTVSRNLRKEGLYDARVSSVARFIHAPGECSCKFSICFFNVQLDTFTGGIHGNLLLDRILLTYEPETEVSISDIRILQKPAKIIPLRDILDAHLDRKWIPLSRCYQDAYFLGETKLSTTKQPRGVFVQDHTDPAHVKSDVVLSPSAAGVSTKNGEKESNYNSPVDGPQLDVRGSRESLSTAEGVYGILKSASGAPENHEQNPAARFADGTCPPSIDIERECVSAEDHDDDLSNSIIDESPKKKRRRPSLERLNQTRKEVEMMPGTGAQILEETKICDNPKVNLTSGLNKDLQSREKEKTRHTLKDEVEIECTELSSDDSEWKPLKALKKLPTMQYNIRTRALVTISHKPGPRRCKRSQK